ncbi:hypothetical protein FK268_19950 [Tsukamurella sputi]|uniref:Helix-turn-helix domain-containing protein n=1 Tax=Tsukamurella sputi TaxID=2591848 RepID=A0A5C5RI90_9ACTN|nr:hypothetical protein [Tsukamurella sputi]TWS22282.1 hypothetical protein FK268_19950 [Tsukamurella sputi]
MHFIEPTDQAPYRTEVAPGLWGPGIATVVTEPGELPYITTATVQPSGGRYLVTKLVAEQHGDGPPIQRGELAKIGVDQFVRFTASHVLARRGNRLGLPNYEAFFERVEKARRVEDDDLPDLAAAYRWIRLQEGKPTTLLSRELGVSLATMKRWIARAADAGHLGREERG